MKRAMARSWLETRIEVPSDEAETFGAQLIDLGSPGLITEERGDRCELVAYFEHDEQIAAVRALVEARGIAAALRLVRIGEENWAQNWKEHFPRIEVGNRLCLCPPWEAPTPGRVGVIIDPGMAFGTGHHATTRACLELLEARVQPGSLVLDVGTGSGVLSIATLLLGAERAVGVDVDAIALEAARGNAARNGVAERFSVAASLEGVDDLFDLALANIQANVLAELEPELSARVKPGGLLIASGLLRQELAAWKPLYAPRWRFGTTSGDAQWVAIEAWRTDSPKRGEP